MKINLHEMCWQTYLYVLKYAYQQERKVEYMLDEKKLNMEACAEKLRALSKLDRIIVISKIDALYERQQAAQELENEKRELQEV